MLIKMNESQLQELRADAQKQMDQTTDEMHREGIQEYIDDIDTEIWEIKIDFINRTFKFHHDQK